MAQGRRGGVLQATVSGSASKQCRRELFDHGGGATLLQIRQSSVPQVQEGYAAGYKAVSRCLEACRLPTAVASGRLSHSLSQWYHLWKKPYPLSPLVSCANFTWQLLSHITQGTVNVPL